jgi:SAM-dependent methyltransferase
VEIACEEQAWPLGEHAADVVVLQHGLDFSLSPHGLLREAARSVRPGGHLLIVGINPWSAWGLRHLLARDALRQARCIAPARVSDWLHLLGFALEKRRFGCYRPPLAANRWQSRLAGLEPLGNAWQMPGGGFYLLVARKLVVGLRPLRQAPRASMGKLLPMPVAKVSRRDAEP